MVHYCKSYIMGLQ